MAAQHKGRVMFSSEHAIWKFAYAGDELDDLLPHAEWRISEWAKQTVEEVRFKNTFDVFLAALLLEDGLLPNSATAAFAKLMIRTIDEVITKKIRVDCLHIEPPKPGRQNNRHETGTRIFKVKMLIAEGKTATEAYKLVSEEHCKSPETIRREYERAIKKSANRIPTGEIKKSFPR